MKKKKGTIMRNNYARFMLSVGLSSFFIACNTTGKLKEGQKLYTKGNVIIESDTIKKENKERLSAYLEESLVPKPNKKFLGIRWKLMFNNMAGDSVGKNFIRRKLKNMGEEPVLLSDVNREYNENLLRNKMENIGFFNAEVRSDTVIHKKEAEVNYTAIPGLIYRIKSIAFDVDSTTEIGQDILSSKNHSVLRIGKNYRLDDVMNERDRIDNDLKNKGYYYFGPDYILAQVDSTIGDHKVDMFVTVKKETPAIAKKPSKIGKIYIYPNYTDGAVNTSQRIPGYAELYDSSYYFIDKHNTYRKAVIAKHIFFKPGDLYNRDNHNRTLSHLVNLNSWKFVKNNFIDSKEEPNTLDVYYYLTPLPKKSLRLELLGKMASVYNGTEANVNWQLRNVFRGAEQLSINVFGGYELQTGGNKNLNSTFIRYGIDATLKFPRILSPFKIAPTRRFIPQTYIKAGYQFLNRRNAYTLNSMNMNYGYIFQEDEKKQHDLGLLEVTYTQPRNITAEYQAQMDTVPTLRHAIEPQFTIGPNYVFTFTNTMETQKKHTFYFKGNIDLSGNLLGLLKGSNFNEGKTFKLLNAYFSQYVKVSGDARHYLKISDNAQLASRVNIGLSYSYGNSNVLPYLKQYFVGGPNSIRAFAARSIGPGSTKPQNLGKNNFIADQTGDFKLEMSTEYRAKLASIVKWAAFIDAGNVWLQNNDDQKPGGKISKNFYKEIAVGGGAGLRFDFTYLILRTDLSIPLRLPYKNNAGNQWVLKDIDFGNREWRRNNLMFNLAIGYPF